MKPLVVCRLTRRRLEHPHEGIGHMAKKISASVGSGAVNRKDDSITVQTLLNKVPANQGGPAPPLVVDVLPWQKTINAIKQFQRVQLGFQWPDGRVDPNGRTLEKLNTFDVVDPADSCEVGHIYCY